MTDAIDFRINQLEASVFDHADTEERKDNYYDIASLITILTSHDKINYQLIADFFLSFRSFISQRSLLKLLILRIQWCIVSIDDASHEQKQNIGKLTLVRTFVMIRHWLLNYFSEDFIPSESLRTDFIQYINSIRHNELFVQRIVGNLKQSWTFCCNKSWDEKINSKDFYNFEIKVGPQGNKNKRLSQLALSQQTDPLTRNSMMLSAFDKNVVHKLPIPIQNKREPKVLLNLKNSNHRFSIMPKSSYSDQKSPTTAEKPRPTLYKSLSSASSHRSTIRDSTEFIKSPNLSKVLPPTPVKRMDFVVQMPPPNNNNDNNNNTKSTRSIRPLIDNWLKTFHLHSDKKLKQNERAESFMKSVVSVAKTDNIDLESLATGKFDILSARTIDELEYLVRFHNELLSKHGTKLGMNAFNDSFSFTIDEPITSDPPKGVSNIDNMNICETISLISKSVISLQQYVESGDRRSYVSYDSVYSKEKIVEANEREREEYLKKKPKFDNLKKFNFDNSPEQEITEGATIQLRSPSKSLPVSPTRAEYTSRQTPTQTQTKRHSTPHSMQLSVLSESTPNHLADVESNQDNESTNNTTPDTHTLPNTVNISSNDLKQFQSEQNEHDKQEAEHVDILPTEEVDPETIPTSRETLTPDHNSDVRDSRHSGSTLDDSDYDELESFVSTYDEIDDIESDEAEEVDEDDKPETNDNHDNESEVESFHEASDKSVHEQEVEQEAVPEVQTKEAQDILPDDVQLEGTQSEVQSKVQSVIQPAASPADPVTEEFVMVDDVDTADMISSSTGPNPSDYINEPSTPPLSSSNDGLISSTPQISPIKPIMETMNIDKQQQQQPEATRSVSSSSSKLDLNRVPTFTRVSTDSITSNRKASGGMDRLSYLSQRSTHNDTYKRSAHTETHKRSQHSQDSDNSIFSNQPKTLNVSVQHKSLNVGKDHDDELDIIKENNKSDTLESENDAEKSISLNSINSDDYNVPYPGVDSEMIAELAAISDDSVQDDPIAAALLKLEGSYKKGSKIAGDPVIPSAPSIHSSNDSEDLSKQVESLGIQSTPKQMKRNSVFIDQRRKTKIFSLTPVKQKVVSYEETSSSIMLDLLLSRKITNDALKISNSEQHISFILNYKSKTLAEQFTLIERDALLEIDWKELVELKWDSDKLVPINSWIELLVQNQDLKGIDLCISRFNLTVNWIISEILLTKNITLRKLTIQRFIHIAQNCKTLQNYSTLLQILLALGSDKISKLTETWRIVEPGDILIYKNLEAISSPLKNFIVLRNELNKIKPSLGCVPFLGLYLSDLVFNKEKRTHDGSKINFGKFKHNSKIVRSLIQCIQWSSLYRLKVDDEVLSKCLYIKALTEVEMHDCLQDILGPS